MTEPAITDSTARSAEPLPSPVMTDRTPNCRPERARLPRALRTVVTRSALPYGYTLTVWSSGAVLMHEHGPPAVGDGFMFIAGGGVARVARVARAPGDGEPLGPASGSLERAGVLNVTGMLEARAAAGALSAASLDAPSGDDNATGSSLGDQLGDEDPGYRACELHDELEYVLSTLDPSAEEAVRLRCADELSYREVAA